MHRVIHAADLPPSPSATVTFEGEPHGSGVSFLLVSSEPGAGPELHTDPYSETWIVRSGGARITADGEQIDAGPRDIVSSAPARPTRSRTLAPISSRSSASTPRRDREK
jgi:mannose-6-phosphate isomerase-like protein (cupin superfamily)